VGVCVPFPVPTGFHRNMSQLCLHYKIVHSTLFAFYLRTLSNSAIRVHGQVRGLRPKLGGIKARHPSCTKAVQPARQSLVELLAKTGTGMPPCSMLSCAAIPILTDQVPSDKVT